MARAFWLFARNDGNGNPDLPAGHGGRTTNPLDITRITGGPSGNEHAHLLVGGVAINSDGIGVQHEHFVIDTGSSVVQVTRGTTGHTHDLATDANGNLTPDWFLLFWHGPDAGATAIENDNNCYIVVDAAIDEDGNIGALDSAQWTAQEQSTWESRVLNVLGVQLPSAVDRGKRLVMLFVGLLQARQSNERGLRFTN